MHVFDRGYCGGPWLGALRCFNVRFIVRFKHRYHLLDAQGEKRAAWTIARGKVGQAPGTIYDAFHRCHVQGSVLFFQVTHPDFPDWPLTLVVGRRKGLEPIYLLTNEEVNTAEDAWKVVLAYIRRWRIEMTFRHLKSDMGMKTPSGVCLAGSSQVAWSADAGLGVFDGSDGRVHEESSRLAVGLCLSPSRPAQARGGGALEPFAPGSLEVVAGFSLLVCASRSLQSLNTNSSCEIRSGLFPSLLRAGRLPACLFSPAL